MMMQIRKLVGLWHREEEGAALTEFAITLPIFMFLLGVVLHLGRAGIASVAVFPAAYQDMWVDHNEQSTGMHLANMSPRAELAGVVPDLNGFHLVDIGDSAISAAVGVGGHWGESKAHLELSRLLSFGGVNYGSGDTDAATRLNNHFGTGGAGPLSLTSSVIGSENYRPKWAFDDNLLDSGSNIFDTVTGTDISVGGIIQSAMSVFFEATGAVPSVFAGIRYGEGRGEAQTMTDVRIMYEWTSQYWYASYATALSPNAHDDQSIPWVDYQIGEIGREQHQYGFYYLTGQTISNQFVTLDIVKQELSGSDSFDAVGKYGESE